MLSKLFQNLRDYTSDSKPLIDTRDMISNQDFITLRRLEESLLLSSFQELLTFSDSVLEFGSIGVKITREKNCIKGWRCGYTCLPVTKKNCTKSVEGQAKTYTAWLEIQAKKEEAVIEVERKLNDSPPTLTRDITKMNISITKDDQKLLDNSKLIGSEKQIAWAESLRTHSLINAKKEAALYAELRTIQMPWGEGLTNYDYERVEKLIVEFIASKKDADFWIDNRNNYTKEFILRPVLRQYSLILAKEDDPRISEKDKKSSLDRERQDNERKLQAEKLQRKYDDLKFPDLEGSEKQVNWAKKIQPESMARAKSKGINPEDIQLALDKSPALKSAKWWIENQTTIDLERVIGKVKERYNVAM